MQGLGDNRRSILDRSTKLLHFSSSSYWTSKVLVDIRLICQKASLHLLITQVLPQAVHDLLRVRGQPQWHLLHLPQQAHLREGLQRECAELKLSQYQLFM